MRARFLAQCPIMIKFYCRGYSVPTTSKNMHLGTILGGKISHQYTDFPQPILYYCDIDRVSFHRIVFFKCTNLYLPDRIFSLELFNRTTYTYQSLSILRHNPWLRPVRALMVKHCQEETKCGFCINACQIPVHIGPCQVA